MRGSFGSALERLCAADCTGKARAHAACRSAGMAVTWQGRREALEAEELAGSTALQARVVCKRPAPWQVDWQKAVLAGLGLGSFHRHLRMHQARLSWVVPAPPASAELQ